MAEPIEPDLKLTTENGGYRVDGLAIVFRAIDDLVQDNDIGPSIVMAVAANGARLDLEALNRELEKLAGDGGGPARTYQSTIRATHTSWGTDGATVTFLLAVGGQLTAELILAGLKRVGAAVRRGPAKEARPITEREANHWAYVMLKARFDDFGDERSATVTKVTLRESGGASVEMLGSDGSTFTIELELHDGLIAVGEVARTYRAA